ncbi:MAG: heat shock protein HspQ [Hyphomonadaceae bacterium]|nr:MAG: heat shock protein HspQ [Hyphomonadaceae bacterium]
MDLRQAKYGIGEIVRHRLLPFRGGYQSIPENYRPDRNQPFYHLLAENSDTHYIAYVSEQNLLADLTGGPIDHPAIGEMFSNFDAKSGIYQRNAPLN